MAEAPQVERRQQAAVTRRRQRPWSDRPSSLWPTPPMIRARGLAAVPARSPAAVQRMQAATGRAATVLPVTGQPEMGLQGRAAEVTAMADLMATDLEAMDLPAMGTEAELRLRTRMPAERFS